MLFRSNVFAVLAPKKSKKSSKAQERATAIAKNNGERVYLLGEVK